jgi:hypothetical protein
VTYVLYPDEGHGFVRPENRIDFFVRAEAFLGQHLGGRVELVNGEKIPGSTAGGSHCWQHVLIVAILVVS